ncbi:hypothetical protein [uncultured Pelagimonas sp.]|uniref:hypothetical protein n=1 Tax=uncultured Pelagimonas sp. TaxID=1618102 RepID=UPI002617E243|nr:hypothetical protein [uncultured Pelagimonas sp.]
MEFFTQPSKTPPPKPALQKTRQNAKRTAHPSFSSEKPSANESSDPLAETLKLQ